VSKLLPLESILAFEAAGRLSSIRNAARLHVTPAVVSRQVRVLESYLGVRLFSRGHRAVTLTPAGRQFLGEISPHFAEIHRAAGKIIGGRNRRVLKIRAYTTFAMRWLIPGPTIGPTGYRPWARTRSMRTAG
jgi:LysR family transcriptional regulator, glycine cleavage system transcriptional activator